MNIYENQSRFIDNGSTCEYYQIVLVAQSESRTKLKRHHPNFVYYEKHHVLPKSMFPEFAKEKWNMVLLKADEHLRCHQLLIDMTLGKDKHKMNCALWNMINRINKVTMERENLDLESFADARNSFSESISQMLIGKSRDSATKRKIGDKNRGKPNAKKGTSLSEHTRELIRKNRPNAVSFHTPMGIFDSIQSFLKADSRFSATGVRLLLLKCDQPITSQRIYSSKYFTIEHLGKTPRSLGFYPL